MIPKHSVADTHPPTTTTFPILTSIPPQPGHLSRHHSPFTVSTFNGFLPLTPPLVDLPPAFDQLTSLLERMPIRTLSGGPGLLAKFSFGATLLAELPNLSAEVACEIRRGDKRVLSALFRDYCFLASAYLLEPCHERKCKGKEEGYGLGRQRLPNQVAGPLMGLAEALGHKPFMEYASSYALYNWRLEDPSKGIEYSNLRLIRAFEQGLDPSSSEAGFVLTHVDMVKHSGRLVRGAVEALDGCGKGDREGFDEGLRTLVEGMKDVNAVMEGKSSVFERKAGINEAYSSKANLDQGMWKRSKPKDYHSFRTFIFGITKQSMFPNGVVYEGVSEEAMDFRGESGSNDSMIPLFDNLLEIVMPDTPLTEILKDFRSYRPDNHREFLEWVKYRAGDVGVKGFAMGGEQSAALYLHALNQVRDFRWRHWCFTREYIIKKTSYPTATGGSPIVLWLPNQLFSIYHHMFEVENIYPNLRSCKDVMEVVHDQRKSLEKEVHKYCAERCA
ncbi:MAG: hypothetical protein Q9217_000046 [Psora testacea]